MTKQEVLCGRWYTFTNVILLNMKEIPKVPTYTSHLFLSHGNFISFLLIAKDTMLEFYLDSDKRF